MLCGLTGRWCGAATATTTSTTTTAHPDDAIALAATEPGPVATDPEPVDGTPVTSTAESKLIDPVVATDTTAGKWGWPFGAGFQRIFRGCVHGAAPKP